MHSYTCATPFETPHRRALGSQQHHPLDRTSTTAQWAGRQGRAWSKAKSCWSGVLPPFLPSWIGISHHQHTAPETTRTAPGQWHQPCHSHPIKSQPWSKPQPPSRGELVRFGHFLPMLSKAISVAQPDRDCLWHFQHTLTPENPCCVYRRRDLVGGRFSAPQARKASTVLWVQQAPSGAGMGGPCSAIALLTPQQNPRHSPSTANNSPSSSMARRSVSPDITGRRDVRRAEGSRERQQPGEAMPQAPGWNLLPRTCSALDFSPSVICAAAQCDCNRCSKRWGPTPKCERGHVEVRNPVPSHRAVTLTGAPCVPPQGASSPGAEHLLWG